jgi:hypothetical protein
MLTMIPLPLPVLVAEAPVASIPAALARWESATLLLPTSVRLKTT